MKAALQRQPIRWRPRNEPPEPTHVVRRIGRVQSSAQVPIRARPSRPINRGFGGRRTVSRFRRRHTGTARRGTARRGTARRGTARRGTARRGTARRGTARRGTARRGIVRRSACRWCRRARVRPCLDARETLSCGRRALSRRVSVDDRSENSGEQQPPRPSIHTLAYSRWPSRRKVRACSTGRSKSREAPSRWPWLTCTGPTECPANQWRTTLGGCVPEAGTSCGPSAPERCTGLRPRSAPQATNRTALQRLRSPMN